VTTVRRLAYLAFGVACTHLVFGAIVRISGSGMGCGDHWPKCYGRWFPPFDRPDLVIEVSHRYLASILMLSLLALLAAAWRRRAEAGVGGRGGVLRGAALAVALGFAAAILGAITVKLGNAPVATVAHWTVAMSLVAAVVATVIRAGGLGGSAARLGGASRRTRRAAFAGAAMALLAVVMGGLTAKYPGAAVACQNFPLCGRNPDVAGAAVHVQLTHRVLALLVVLHLLGMVIALRRRREAPIVRRAATIAFSLGVLQLLVAGAMIGMHLPPMLRSLHEATGVSIWIATFALAYLARLASEGTAAARESSPPLAASPDGASLSAAEAASVRASAASRHAYASALAEAPRAERERDPAPSPEIAPPPTDVLPSPSGVPPLKMTMQHSVAVIVARGAEH
jgi:cytochrome c oxidase assembly protein subunit 15